MIGFYPPAFMYEENGNLFCLMGVQDNWLIVSIMPPDSNKPMLTGVDVFSSRKGYEDLPDYIFNNMPALLQEAENKRTVLPDNIGMYVWDKCIEYFTNGYGSTSKSAKRFEEGYPSSVIFIKDFFQPYNVKNHVMIFEKAVSMLLPKFRISENYSSIINEPRGNNTNLEERFVTAYEYLCNTTAKDIAIRTSIYGAYVNMYLHKNFAHDYYLDIVAALCGPFKFNALIEDKIVMKMLNDTMYGFVDVSSGWITPLRNWIVSNGGYKCDDLLSRIIAYLDQGKGNEILEQFNYIVQVVQPDEYTYFPEMNSSMNRYSNSSTWPRI